MQDKSYNLGLIIGRFQGFHKGHQYMIEKALELCELVLVYIGSSQESYTERNPFTYEERKEMIRKCFPDKGELFILPLPDAGVGDNEDWGTYVLNKTKEDIGMDPDLIISGMEDVRKSWFTSENAPNSSILFISRSKIPYSGSLVRKALIDEDWFNMSFYKTYIPRELLDYEPLINLKDRKLNDK